MLPCETHLQLVHVELSPRNLLIVIINTKNIFHNTDKNTLYLVV